MLTASGEDFQRITLTLCLEQWKERRGKHREKIEGWKTDFTVWFQKCKEKAKDLKVRDFCQGPKISIYPKWMEKKRESWKGKLLS